MHAVQQTQHDDTMSMVSGRLSSAGDAEAPGTASKEPSKMEKMEKRLARQEAEAPRGAAARRGGAAATAT